MKVIEKKDHHINIPIPNWSRDVTCRVCSSRLTIEAKDIYSWYTYVSADCCVCKYQFLFKAKELSKDVVTYIRRLNHKDPNALSRP